MADEFTPLTVQAYAEQAMKSDRGVDSKSLSFPLLGLFGETGSLLSEVKKKQRDRASYIGYAGAVVEELGDVLWYLTLVAARGGIQLKDIVANLNRGFVDWKHGDNEEITMASLQPAVIPSLQQLAPTSKFEVTLLQLAGEVGHLLTEHEAGRLKDNQASLAGLLIAITRKLIQAANEAGVSLEAAAVKNLHKVNDRWPNEKIYPPSFDELADREEKLPRSLRIEIYEREVRGQLYVFQRCNDIAIGDRLTDNAIIADDYRFHDVFHYAHVAVLGWSPVIRSLLRLKRKSDPKIDEVQDGARATLIEEGLTTWIFGQATDLNYFSNIKYGELPFDLLKQVRQFVAGYEVAERPLWLWEEAIIEGYAAFRFLQHHRRGIVTIDMLNHKLRVENLT